MPLVRSSLMRGKRARFAQRIGAIVVEVKMENWSFGGRVAQYAE